MLKNRINRSVILQGIITFAGILAAVQVASNKKVQAQPALSSRRKGILLAVDLQNGFTKQAVSYIKRNRPNNFVIFARRISEFITPLLLIS